MLREGTTAPGFTLEVSDGGTASLSDYRGKTVVLYFCPKDDTPGCTKVRPKAHSEQVLEVLREYA